MESSAKQRLRLTIQASPLGADVQSFPVLVTLSPRVFDYARADRDALVFRAAGAGAALPYEVETWDPNGDSAVWVQVPVLGPDERTLDLYYDGTDEVTVDSSAVWDDGFEAVQHFNAAEGTLADSTTGGPAGTTYGGPSYREQGLAGHALRLDGSNDYVDLGTTVLGAAGNAVTISSSVFLDPAALTANYAMIAARDVFGGAKPGEQFAQLLQKGSFVGGLNFGGTPVRPKGSSLTVGWHSLDTTYDGATITTYVDGEFVASTPRTGSFDPAGVPLSLGAYSGASGGFAALTFDEFRLSSTARSADWLRAQHLAVRDGLVASATPQREDEAHALLLHMETPSQDQSFGTGGVPLRGTVSVPSTVTYTLDGGAPVVLGIFDGAFDRTISGLPEGPHTLALTAKADDGRTVTKTATFSITTGGPTITFGTPEDGARYSQEFEIDVRAADPDTVKSLTLELDGQVVANGDRIHPDDLGTGTHRLVATALDGVGNTTVQQVEFTVVGNDPQIGPEPVPGDAAKDIDPRNATLSVTATDPTDDPLGVTFRWTHAGSVEAGSVTQGTTVAATPAVGAGEPVADGAALAAADGEQLTTSADGAYPFQQFTVAVPSKLGAARFSTQWRGHVPRGHRAVLSVWNYDEKRWQEIGDQNGTGQALTVAGEAKVSDAVRGGTARVMVQDRPAAVLDDDDVLRFAWMTDTQFYSRDNSSIFDKQVDQILSNREADDISYAVHTGDVVNTATSATEWQYAARQLRKLSDAGFPWGVEPGNHDKTADGEYREYRSHFGARFFQDNPWYGGKDKDNVNHYDLVSTPKAEYLMLYLDWDLTPDELDWADAVVKAHPDHNVIVATHAYLDLGGSLMDGSSYGGPGKKIYDRIVAPNPNVHVVLCGHNHGVSMNVKQVSPGRNVVEVLFDPQSAPNGGNGWMRYVDLDAAAGTMTHRTFSVSQPGRSFYRDDSTLVVTDPAETLTDSLSENFTVPVALSGATREVSTDALTVSAAAADPIGGAPVKVEDGKASLRLTDLEPNTTYHWQAVATDDSGFETVSPSWSFTTGPATSTEPPVAGPPPAGPPAPGPSRGASALTVKDVSVVYGKKLTLTAELGDQGATGTVTFGRRGTAWCVARVQEGTASCDVPTRRNPGKSALVARYSGDDRFRPASEGLAVRVKRAKPSISVRSSARSVRARSGRARITVRVKAAAGVAVSGKVRVTVAGRSRTVQLVKGKATVAAARQRTRGRKTVRVVYWGSDRLTQGVKSTSFRVR